jgi:hypothetical protein
MKGRWDHGRRHECSISLGTSDVSYYHGGNGWIELKEVKQLPARPSTGVKLGQWHENGGAQRHFLVKRRGWLLIRINAPKRQYLLFDWASLPPWEKHKAWNYEQLCEAAYSHWYGRIDWDQFAEEIECAV